MSEPDARSGHPQDDARTMRDHAGEAIVDTRNWPGYICIGAALAALGMTLTAAAYGFEGWAWTGATVVLVSTLLGIALVLLERKRVKSDEGKDLTDAGGH